MDYSFTEYFCRDPSHVPKLLFSCLEKLEEGSKKIMNTRHEIEPSKQYIVYNAIPLSNSVALTLQDIDRPSPCYNMPVVLINNLPIFFTISYKYCEKDISRDVVTNIISNSLEKLIPESTPCKHKIHSLIKVHKTSKFTRQSFSNYLYKCDHTHISICSLDYFTFNKIVSYISHSPLSQPELSDVVFSGFSNKDTVNIFMTMYYLGCNVGQTISYDKIIELSRGHFIPKLPPNYGEWLMYPHNDTVSDIDSSQLTNFAALDIETFGRIDATKFQNPEITHFMYAFTRPGDSLSCHVLMGVASQNSSGELPQSLFDVGSHMKAKSVSIFYCKNEECLLNLLIGVLQRELAPIVYTYNGKTFDWMKILCNPHYKKYNHKCRGIVLKYDQKNNTPLSLFDGVSPLSSFSGNRKTYSHLTNTFFIDSADQNMDKSIRKDHLTTPAAAFYGMSSTSHDLYVYESLIKNTDLSLVGVLSKYVDSGVLNKSHSTIDLLNRWSVDPSCHKDALVYGVVDILLTLILANKNNAFETSQSFKYSYPISFATPYFYNASTLGEILVILSGMRYGMPPLAIGFTSEKIPHTTIPNALVNAGGMNSTMGGLVEALRNPNATNLIGTMCYQEGTFSCIDVRSLYPSIIEKFNIGHNTCMPTREHVKSYFKGKSVKFLKDTPGTTHDLINLVVCGEYANLAIARTAAKLNYEYCDSSDNELVEEGIDFLCLGTLYFLNIKHAISPVATYCRDALSTRQKIKSEMKKLKVSQTSSNSTPDPNSQLLTPQQLAARLSLLDKQQLAAKLAANSIYGHGAETKVVLPVEDEDFTLTRLKDSISMHSDILRPGDYGTDELFKYFTTVPQKRHVDNSRQVYISRSPLKSNYSTYTITSIGRQTTEIARLWTCDWLSGLISTNSPCLPLEPYYWSMDLFSWVPGSKSNLKSLRDFGCLPMWCYKNSEVTQAYRTEILAITLKDMWTKMEKFCNIILSSISNNAILESRVYKLNNTSIKTEEFIKKLVVNFSYVSYYILSKVFIPKELNNILSEHPVKKMTFDELKVALLWCDFSELLSWRSCRDLYTRQRSKNDLSLQSFGYSFYSTNEEKELLSLYLDILRGLNSTDIFNNFFASPNCINRFVNEPLFFTPTGDTDSYYLGCLGPCSLAPQYIFSTASLIANQNLSISNSTSESLEYWKQWNKMTLDMMLKNYYPESEHIISIANKILGIEGLVFEVDGGETGQRMVTFQPKKYILYNAISGKIKYAGMEITRRNIDAFQKHLTEVVLRLPPSTTDSDMKNLLMKRVGSPILPSGSYLSKRFDLTVEKVYKTINNERSRLKLSNNTIVPGVFNGYASKSLWMYISNYYRVPCAKFDDILSFKHFERYFNCRRVYAFPVRATNNPSSQNGKLNSVASSMVIVPATFMEDNVVPLDDVKSTFTTVNNFLFSVFKNFNFFDNDGGYKSMSHLNLNTTLKNADSVGVWCNTCNELHEDKLAPHISAFFAQKETKSKVYKCGKTIERCWLDLLYEKAGEYEGLRELWDDQEIYFGVESKKIDPVSILAYLENWEQEQKVSPRRFDPRYLLTYALLCHPDFAKGPPHNKVILGKWKSSIATRDCSNALSSCGFIIHKKYPLPPVYVHMK